MIIVENKSKFQGTFKFLRKTSNFNPLPILNAAGQEGVNALRAYTPVDTGVTAASWNYTIKKNSDGYAITFKNSNVVNGVPIAIILQYGHGTGTGGYVKGIDYINPALRPIFEALAQKAWKEVQ